MGKIFLKFYCLSKAPRRETKDSQSDNQSGKPVGIEVGINTQFGFLWCQPTMASGGFQQFRHPPMWSSFITVWSLIVLSYYTK